MVPTAWYLSVKALTVEWTGQHLHTSYHTQSERGQQGLELWGWGVKKKKTTEQYEMLKLMLCEEARINILQAKHKKE